MTSASRCRLMVDAPAPGAWNMAVDEVLLTAAEEGVATLRLYQWSEPTLSLGYFQKYSDREQHAASRAAAVVRRQTGGGAILHDRELTYSLALPASHPLAGDNQRLYAVVHQAVIDLLAPWMDQADRRYTLRRQSVASCRGASQEPFLCFARRACGDVLVVPAALAAGEPATDSGNWKVLGSAQRRRRGAILQHGSLLLGRSPAAPELAGLGDLVGIDVQFDELARRLPQLLAGPLHVELREAELSNGARQRAVATAGRYGQPAWTKRR